MKKHLKSALLGALGCTIIVWLMVLSIPFASAWSNNTFNISLTTEKLTFTKNENITRYLSVPENTLLTNARLNITGGNGKTPFALWTFDNTYNSTNGAYNWTSLTNGAFTTNGFASSALFGKDAAANPLIKLLTSNQTLKNNTYNNGTWTMWVNMSVFSTGAGQYTWLFGIDDAGTANDTLLFFYKYSSSLVNLYAQFQRDTGTVYNLNSSGFNNNSWQMITMTWNSSSWRLYINDTLVDKNDSTFVNLNRFADRPFFIGGSDALPRYNFSLDELKVFDYALSPQEVSDLYQDYPINVSLFVNNTNVWNYSSYRYTSTNTTNDLSSVINTYTKGCVLIDGYCNIPFKFHSDTNGTLTYSDMLFDSSGIIKNNVTFINTTYETATENYILNFTYDSTLYDYTKAYLWYNDYAKDELASGAKFDILFTSRVDSTITNYPSYSIANATYDIWKWMMNPPIQNNSFYWEIDLVNATGTYQYNTSIVNVAGGQYEYNQTIKELDFGECAGTTTTKSLNITAYAQGSGTKINNFNLSGTIAYLLGTGNYTKVYTFANNSINQSIMCINVNRTYNLLGLMQMSKPGYQTVEYYFFYTHATKTLQDIKIGLLDTTLTTDFVIQLYGQNNLALPGYYININRCEPSNITNCMVVQSVKTDGNGQGIAFIEINNVYYKFQVYNEDGELVYTSDTRKITPQTSPYTITLVIGENYPNPINYLNNVTGITWALSFNNNSKVASVTYSMNQSFDNVSFSLFPNTPSYTNTIICDVSSTSSTGILSCNLSNNDTGSYIAEFHASYNGDTYFIDRLIITIETFSQTVGNLGIFAGFIILLICGFVFSYNHVAGIVALDLGVIFTNVMGFISWGIAPITAIIAISIIILIVLERD